MRGFANVRVEAHSVGDNENGDREPKAEAIQNNHRHLTVHIKVVPPSHSVVLREFCHGLQHLAVTAQGCYKSAALCEKRSIRSSATF